LAKLQEMLNILPTRAGAMNAVSSMAMPPVGAGGAPGGAPGAGLGAGSVPYHMRQSAIGRFLLPVGECMFTIEQILEVRKGVDDRRRPVGSGGGLMVVPAWCMVHGAWCMVHGAWCMAAQHHSAFSFPYLGI
jgi:hypothetical protein